MRGAAARGRVLALLGAVLLVLLPQLTAGTARADTIRERQWPLTTVGAYQAWETTRGAGVTVAVLDTGVDAGHPDLRGAVLPGRDVVGFGADEGDEAWARHGTAMAGIIAGRGHGPGGQEGVIGIAPEAEILPVRVLLEEADPARDEARDARGSALAEGIRWAVDQGADVINLSLGDDSASAHPDAEEDAAVRYALREGAVVVASAGNGGEDGDPVSYPAAYPGVIAVTAVDRDGARAPFSTRRWYATVSAPGKDVVIADPDRRYYHGWGTSAAAAVVSGAVALVRAAHPGLSPAQIRQLLADTARATPPGGRSDALGAGVVDAAAAVEAGARIEPGAQVPEPRAHTAEHFGPGPAPKDDADTGWLAVGAGVLGALFVGAAVSLYLSARPPRRT
ncbi:type VII secretion-associated serine protease mycosin [Streptomyces sp. TRM 70351]|uniref:type VII secretion-associated serine protease mycosin n=1 Tax=Streptomyces sp. TRM 70351 TaxID=3116552 RepID=UPI002E7BDFFB|nr:type VII secretion-associated serine protease mycosin [Streptomyces sp. TRM 70351]MEE1929143.1 type VII secretion-associated serine protease mycosin [Streptomyces sp. TRM 70351]